MFHILLSIFYVKFRLYLNNERLAVCRQWFCNAFQKPQTSHPYVYIRLILVKEMKFDCKLATSHSNQVILSTPPSYIKYTKLYYDVKIKYTKHGSHIFRGNRVRVMVFNATFDSISVIIITCTWRKSQTCRKLLINFITKCCIQYTSPCLGF